MDEESVPQLFVEGQFLPNKWVYRKTETEYNINGEVFTLQNDDNDDYYKFKVVSDTDSLGESSTLDKEECKFLPVSIKKTLYGVIVNDAILLPINNWNTIITLEDHIWCCVCLDLDVDAITHIKRDMHIKSMNEYQPLQRFDLNLVRLIDQHYHCAVCNESFHKSEENHFDSETHENKILYAINHCSDVQDMHNIDQLTYPFDPLFAHLFDSSQPQSFGSSIPHSVEPSHYHSIEHSPIESPSVSSSHSRADYVESVSTSESGIDFNEMDGFNDIIWDNMPVELSYASVATAVPKLFFINWFGTKYKIDNDAWNMIIMIKSQKIYCMACKIIDDAHVKLEHCFKQEHIENLKLCTPVEKYKNYIIRKVDEKFYHCANCNNLQLESMVANHIERTHKQKTKPLKNKIQDTPKAKEVPRKQSSEIENEIESKINSNNMQKNDSKRKVTEEKFQEITVTKSKDQEINDTQSQVLNNIESQGQAINDIESQGQAINQIENQGQPINEIESQGQAINNIESQGQPINEIESQGQIIINCQENNNDDDITKREIIILQFGCSIKISLLSFHLVFVTQNNDCYCNLCDKTVSKQHISQHLMDGVHIFLMQRMFIPNMGVNLIRIINVTLENGIVRLNGGLHCALCHCVMNNNSLELNKHITTSFHIVNLNKALRNGQKTQDDNTEEKEDQKTIENENYEGKRVEDMPTGVVDLNNSFCKGQGTQHDITEEKKEERPIEKENDEENKHQVIPTGVVNINKALYEGQTIRDENTEEKKDQRPIEEENIEGNRVEDTPTGVVDLNNLCNGQITQNDNTEETKDQKPKENDEEKKVEDTPTGVVDLNKSLCKGQRTQDDDTEDKTVQRPIEKENDEENRVEDTPTDVVDLNKALCNGQRTQNENTEENKVEDTPIGVADLNKALCNVQRAQSYKTEEKGPRPIEKENFKTKDGEDTSTGLVNINKTLGERQKTQDDNTEEKKKQRPIKKESDKRNRVDDTTAGVVDLNNVCNDPKTQDDNTEETKNQGPIEKENVEKNNTDTPIDAEKPDKDDNFVNMEKASDANIKPPERVIRKSKIIKVPNENKTERDPANEIYTELVNNLRNKGLWKNIGDVRVNEIFFEIIMAKLKNKNIKISFASYNTFVSVGNGTWYCLVCSVELFKMGVHFTIDGHLKNLKKHAFIDKYDINLIRRNRQYYHCGVCNIMITKDDLQTHITWNEHTNNLSDSMKNRNRNLKELKSIDLSLGKETQFHDLSLHTKIVANYKFEAVNTTSVAKKNKIIIHAGKSFKLTWDAWQGVTKNKNGYKCILCRVDMKNYDLSGHVNTERHTTLLKSFEKKYLPALIRKINDSTVNCLTCDSEVSSKEHILLDHIKGKKHLKNHKYILNVSDKGCYDDVLNL
ncbi:uncharacterized protein LOC111001063 [Pieris rapae]|uniref:uncharacterized protein LOC111001063 n=1 Tax=Pieris rapae TaxID=64459 RepID=UPI001E27F1DB|nr:uncharacterized protein LOC111001063 [Pieris rapae]